MAGPSFHAAARRGASGFCRRASRFTTSGTRRPRVGFPIADASDAPSRPWRSFASSLRFQNRSRAVRLRFPKSARLARASEFQKLKREGVSFHGKFMVLSVLHREETPAPTRIGIITSRRVGGAVVRNRVRRRLREIFRADRGLVAADRWLVLIARQRAAGAKFEELRAEWRGLAARAGLLNVAA